MATAESRASDADLAVPITQRIALQQAIWPGLRGLSMRHAEAVLLRDVVGLAEAVTSEMLGISVGAVKGTPMAAVTHSAAASPNSSPA